MLKLHCDHRNLKHNELNGTLDLGTAYSSQLRLIDLQSNKIDNVEPSGGVSKVKTM